MPKTATEPGLSGESDMAALALYLVSGRGKAPGLYSMMDVLGLA